MVCISLVAPPILRASPPRQQHAGKFRRSVIPAFALAFVRADFVLDIVEGSLS